MLPGGVLVHSRSWVLSCGLGLLMGRTPRSPWIPGCRRWSWAGRRLSTPRGRSSCIRSGLRMRLGSGDLSWDLSWHRGLGGAWWSVMTHLVEWLAMTLAKRSEVTRHLTSSLEDGAVHVAQEAWRSLLLDHLCSGLVSDFFRFFLSGLYIAIWLSLYKCYIKLGIKT